MLVGSVWWEVVCLDTLYKSAPEKGMEKGRVAKISIGCQLIFVIK